jgi:signal peptidase I
VKDDAQMNKGGFLSLSMLLVSACLNESTVKMPNISMEPTIKMGASITIDQNFYSNKSVKRFDIVVVEDPDKTVNKHVKRIIGLGGEKFQIRDGKILINGNLLKEPFSSITADEDFAEISIPDDEYLLLGDNRAHSYDSRNWKKKTVNKSNIVAKVIKF